MRYMKKGFVFTLFIIVLLLCSCSNKINTKSESEILEDILIQDCNLSDYKIKVSSSNITKRQTNEDNKTDYIWISIIGETEVLNYFADYELTYSLYNDGWLLDDFDTVDYRYEPKNEPDMEEVESAIPAEYTDCILIETKEANRMYRYFFLGNFEKSAYLTVPYVLEVRASFYVPDGWIIEFVAESPVMDNLSWHIDGDWKYSDDDISISATVHDFSPYSSDTPTAIKYVLHIEYTVNTANATLSSDGVVKCYLGECASVAGFEYVTTDNPKGRAPKIKDIFIYGAGTETGICFSVWDGEHTYDRFLTQITEK